MNPRPATPPVQVYDLAGLAEWCCTERADWPIGDLQDAITGGRTNGRPDAWLAKAMVTAAMDGDELREFRNKATEAWRERPEEVATPEQYAAGVDRVLAAGGLKRPDGAR